MDGTGTGKNRTQTSMNGKLRLIATKYNQLPVQAKSSLWFAICNMLQRGLGMLTTPIFTRLFTTEEYGVFSLYNAWEQLLILLLALPLFQALYNLYVKYEDKNMVLSAVVGLNITVCLFWGLVYFVLRDWVVRLLNMPEMLCDLMFMQLLVQPIITNWTVHQSFFYNYKKMAMVSLSSSFISVIASLAAVLLASSNLVEHRVGANLCVIGVIAFILLSQVIKSNKRLYNREIWFFTLAFCIPLLPHFLSEFILSTSDRMMIGYFCTKTDVALYSVAYSFAMLLTLLTSSINASFVPFQTRKISECDYAKLSPLAIGVYIFLAFALSALMLLGPEVIFIFGGKKYESAIWVIPPICLGVFFSYMFQIFARVEQLFEKKLYLVSATLISALLNIILNMIFIPIYGYVAAAYTTLVCYICLCFTHYYFYIKVCNQCLEGARIYDVKLIVNVSMGLVGFTSLIYVTYSYADIVRYAMLVLLAGFAIANLKRIKLILSFN